MSRNSKSKLAQANRLLMASKTLEILGTSLRSPLVNLSQMAGLSRRKCKARIVAGLRELPPIRKSRHGSKHRPVCASFLLVAFICLMYVFYRSSS
jgi:hypothetical protein